VINLKNCSALDLTKLGKIFNLLACLFWRKTSGEILITLDVVIICEVVVVAMSPCTNFYPWL